MKAGSWVISTSGEEVVNVLQKGDMQYFSIKDKII